MVQPSGSNSSAYEFLAAAYRQRRDDGLQRNGAVGEFLPRVAYAGHRGPKCFVQGHREEGRRRIRSVVHILVEQALGAALSAHQTDRVNVEEQRCFAARLTGLRIEYPGLAEAQLDRVQPVGMLVQQKAEVGCRLMGARDGQKHTAT